MFRKPCATASAAVIAVALTLGLSACQAGPEASESPVESVSSSPTTSPSPSVSPTPEDPAKAAKAENVAEAKQRYREYQSISSKHARKGQSPFSKLMSEGYLGSPEVQESEQSFWAQYTELRLKEVGKAGIKVVDVTKYEGDPLQEDVTGHRVHMKVCIDNRNYDVVNPDGTSALQKESPDKVLMRVVMQGQKQDGIWSVNDNTSTGKAC